MTSLIRSSALHNSHYCKLHMTRLIQIDSTDTMLIAFFQLALSLSLSLLYSLSSVQRLCYIIIIILLNYYLPFIWCAVYAIFTVESTSWSPITPFIYSLSFSCVCVYVGSMSSVMITAYHDAVDVVAVVAVHQLLLLNLSLSLRFYLYSNRNVWY